MLFYSLILYLSLHVLVKYLTNTTMLLLAIVSGVAIATKVSSIIFIVPILITFFFLTFKKGRNNLIKNTRYLILNTGYFLIITLISAIIFSPHNLLNWPEFLGSMRYESVVAAGTIKVFYTRQFENTIPILFQLQKIFPYALGWPMFILTILGFLGLSWRDKRINLLRFAFLAYFIPTAFLYAKWTRFMTPILPILTIFAILFMFRVSSSMFQSKKILYWILNTGYLILIALFIIPGLAYLSIYQTPDVRFQASQWIYKNIPADSRILSETANVVDLPITSPQQQFNQLTIQPYNYVSFDFYNLDTNPALQQKLKLSLQKELKTSPPRN